LSSQPAVSPLGVKILILMAQGLPAQAIAENLDIGEQEIEYELSQTLCSLGLHSRVELILFAYSSITSKSA
jgi:DNA-binding NarL/FixJ family response regulator